MDNYIILMELKDPARCCQDGGRDQIAEQCTQKIMGNGQKNNGPPSLETATVRIYSINLYMYILLLLSSFNSFDSA